VLSIRKRMHSIGNITYDGRINPQNRQTILETLAVPLAMLDAQTINQQSTNHHAVAVIL